MQPVSFQWTGAEMEPLRRFQKACDEQFTIGEVYTLAPVETRSQASHNHYFALIAEAWLNLPEGLEDRFPTAEHLRKYALIKAGHRDERSIVCASKAEATRIAAFMKPLDEYAIIVPSEAVVTVYTAKSQSTRAMGKQVFQQSKDDVLAVLSDMIGAPLSSVSVKEGV